MIVGYLLINNYINAGNKVKRASAVLKNLTIKFKYFRI